MYDTVKTKSERTLVKKLEWNLEVLLSINKSEKHFREIKSIKQN